MVVCKMKVKLIGSSSLFEIDTTWVFDIKIRRATSACELAQNREERKLKLCIHGLVLISKGHVAHIKAPRATRCLWCPAPKLVPSIITICSYEYHIVMYGWCDSL